MTLDLMLPLLSDADQRVLLSIDGAINRGDSPIAIAAARSRLASSLPTESQERSALLGILAGFLIDGGDAGNDEGAIEEGIQILEDPENEIRQHSTEESVEYNLGNGKYSLYKARTATPTSRFRATTIELLTEAKNHFWCALKATEKSGSTPSPELCVNLANTLDSCGRVVEALTWYDRALTITPAFPMALINRGQCLLFLNSLSDTYTLSMLSDALDGFEQANASGKLGTRLDETCQEHIDRLRTILKDQDVDFADIAQHKQQLREASELSSFRKLCVENRLALSEHALYCSCRGAASDDLSIPKRAGAIGGAFVPKFELYLNRLKSEFALARVLFLQPNGTRCTDRQFDATYTDVLGNETNGIQIEGSRTAFRLCFGILDKIALGICDLFDLATDKQPLYFERFWKHPAGKAQSGRSRWDEINTLDNIPLVALYSLATDLNQKNGEWAEFKQWRNALEHGLLLVGSSEERFHSPLIDEEWARSVIWIEETLFRQRTHHLLQFTASAIFSFAFCVRVEGMKRRDDGGVPFTFEQVPTTR